MANVGTWQLPKICFSSIQALASALFAAEKAHAATGNPASDWPQFYASWIAAQQNPDYSACHLESNPLRCIEEERQHAESYLAG